MKGYLLIEYGRDENGYDVYFTRKSAEEAFIKKVKDYAHLFDDEEILEDDMEELAEGGIYAPNDEVVLEITPCNIAGEKFCPQEG